MSGEDMQDHGYIINLDRPREFKLTWNTMVALQDRYKTAEAAFEKIAAGDFEAIRYLLCAAQTGEDPLTEEELGALITPATADEAFRVALGIADPAPKKRRGIFGLIHSKNAKRPRP